MVKIKENVCPICYAENKCEAQSEEPCWCNQVKVPKKLLASLPDEQRGKSCICLSCIKAFNEASSK